MKKGLSMTREEMIAAIDGEITRLERVRELLRQSNSSRFTAPGDGRAAAVKGTRVLSEDARRRIALAQKRRWAKQRKEKSGRAGK